MIKLSFNRAAGVFVAVLMLCLLLSEAQADENGTEIYHILQKGYVQIEGSTNLFKFTGKSVRHSGKLVEDESGLYTGLVMLRFDQISFQLPAVDLVLKNPGYLDSESYPTIEIRLDHFDPHQNPSLIEGMLNLHGVKKKIQIQVDLQDISPIVKAKGQFSISQSEFKISPYKSGILEIDDTLTVSFQLFFCETYNRIPDDDPLDNSLLQEILLENNIEIIVKPAFFGCAELQN